MATRTIKKNLAGEEDILYGEGTAIQTRNDAAYNITKVHTIKPVSSITELNALDTSKFTKAALFADGDVTLYQYEAGSGLWEIRPIYSVTSEIVHSQPTTAFSLEAYLLNRFVANIFDYDPVANATTDDAAALQAAIDTGKSVYIPKGTFAISSVTADYPVRIFGEGMDTTFIYPITGNSTIVIATDNVTVCDMTFFGQGGTGQAAITGSCIEFDAVTNNPGFTRHMEGCKIERVKFRNLKMNGIYVSHLLRESHIRECRFVGMGNAIEGTNGIRMQNTKGNASNINNIWIVDNQFYRFDNPPISGLRSTQSLAGPSFADIRIRGNLIHGQLLDESGGGVEPEDTDHVRFQDGTNIDVTDNFFTSIHPLNVGLNVTNIGTVGKSVICTNNHMSVKATVGGTTYSRTGPDFATGSFVSVVGSETVNIEGNEHTAGVFVADYVLNNGDYTTTIDVNVAGNTSQGGTIVADFSALGTWRGRIEQSDLITIQADHQFDGQINSSDILPKADAVFDLGSAALRYDRVFTEEVKFGNNRTFASGVGSPEGVVAAGVGSMYTDETGGAGTTLYIKESGNGNTGWVAK